MDEGLPADTTEGEFSTARARRERGISAVQQVYDHLRHLIINLKLPPGAPVAKSKIAADFGLSQTPVREALLRLSDEGLVDIFPQSGTMVSLIDVQHAREAHFIRLAVEVEVQRVLAETIQPVGMAELRAWVERQTTELKAGSQTAFKQADNQFHDAMFQLAGVQGLTRLLQTQRGHYDRIRGLYLREHERRETVVEEHNAILAALDKRDAAGAEAGVRRHLGKSLAQIDEIRELNPGYFL
ncbi:MAG: GntR family transcriptional regulator [Hyphomicrobiaceae bacterium]|nr:GntR family transcriptional regulator [Hyphomicrobiaceae bacterium]